jgi:serine/threonine protein kinase/tetratricopeptide (TPR) repeat protein
MIICPDDDTLLTPILTDQFVGTVLADRYEIQEKLGTGGMGLVYKAKHLLMKRMVAIKLMLPQYASNAVALKRFQHEAQASSHLNHPNILTVYDFGVTPQGQPYLVMDLLEGTNLSAVLEAEGYLHPARALHIFIQACAALGHAHQKNVIHRDLKPGNIMLVEYEGRNDWVQIVDFGMAKILTAIDGEKEDLTKAGEVFGSPMYMSPEQCMAKELDARSDIYSLGCVMYRTLTGTPAVAGQTAMECFNKHANGEPAPFASVCPEFSLSENLEAIVFKAMAKDPEDRYQSMLDMRDALMQEAQLGVDISSSMPAGTVKMPVALVERSMNDVKPLTPLATDASPRATGSNLPTGLPVDVTAGGSANGGIPSLGQIAAGSGKTPSKAELDNSRTAFAEQTIVPVHAPSASEMRPAKATPKGIIYSCIAGAGIIALACYLSFSGLNKNSATPTMANATAGGAIPAENTGEDRGSFTNTMRQGHAAFDHGDYPEAQNRFQAALQKARDASDYDTGVPEARLWSGRTYFETEDFDKAKEQFQELVNGSEKSNHMDSIDATEAMNYLGNIYVTKKNYKQAQKWFDKSYSIRKNYKGDNYGQVAETLAGMGNLNIEQGKFKDAVKVLKQAEKIADGSKAFEEVDKARIYNALGQAYQFLGKTSDAETYYQKALEIRQTKLNPENPAIADTLVLMGTLAFGKHDLAKSEDLLKRALDIQLKALGNNSLSVATTKFCLGVLYQREKKPDLAKPLVQDAYRVRNEQLGPDDSDTLQTRKFLKSLG